MKSINIWLRFIGTDGRILYDNKLTTLPLREEIIIAKSIEFFNDPEPCMIHRSAVMQRIYFELSEFFTLYLNKGNLNVEWVCLPDHLRSYLDIKSRVERIETRQLFS